MSAHEASQLPLFSSSLQIIFVGLFLLKKVESLSAMGTALRDEIFF
jgi:hypothetical protein